MSAYDWTAARMVTVPYSEPPASLNHNDLTNSFRKQVYLHTIRRFDENEDSHRQEVIEFDSKSELSRSLAYSLAENFDFYGFEIELNGKTLWKPLDVDDRNIPDSDGQNISELASIPVGVSAPAGRVVDAIEKREIIDYANKQEVIRSGTRRPPQVIFAMTDFDDPGKSARLPTRDQAYGLFDDTWAVQADQRHPECLDLVSFGKNQTTFESPFFEKLERSDPRRLPYSFLSQIFAEGDSAYLFLYGGRHRLKSVFEMLIASHISVRQATLNLERWEQEFTLGRDRVSDISAPTYDRLMSSLLPFGHTLPLLFNPDFDLTNGQIGAGRSTQSPENELFCRIRLDPGGS